MTAGLWAGLEVTGILGVAEARACIVTDDTGPLLDLCSN